MSIPLLRRIVVAVDGSEPSLKAVSFASQLAKQTNSRLQILNVILLPANASPRTLENLRAELLKKSAQILEKSEAMASPAKIETDTKFVETSQSVVERIVEHSDREKADLIVLGSRGTTMGKLMLGSIAAGTANLAHCSVLVVR